MIDCSSLYDSNEMIAAIIDFFIFDENAKENFWATKGMGGGRGTGGEFFSLCCFHISYKRLSLQSEGGKRRGERKAKAVGLEWDDWVVILFMTAMRGQWRLKKNVFMFARVKDSIVVVLMGIYC
jgi:hypothetical protein